MIILALELVGRALLATESVDFLGHGYAEGFRLTMPGREWDALGRPQTIEFVASAERLGVRAGWIEQSR